MHQGKRGGGGGGGAAGANKGGALWGSSAYLGVDSSRPLHGLKEADSFMRFQVAHTAAKPQHAQHGRWVPAGQILIRAKLAQKLIKAACKASLEKVLVPERHSNSCQIY